MNIFRASLLQITFQAVLSTDGNVTFITFVYEDLNQVRSTLGSGSAAIGFDAGDNSRSTSIACSDQSLNFVNIFRIDGTKIATSGR